MREHVAWLYGGPRDQARMPLDGIPFELHFPRYSDHGRLVHDIYVHESTSFLPERQAYRYEGERIPPRPPVSALPLRETFRDRLAGLLERAASRLRR
jgi:hypothetical protein